MKKLYLIATSGAIARDSLQNCLESLPGHSQWFFSMPNSLFEYYSGSAQELYDGIKAKLGLDERFFVTEIPIRNAQGWIPKAHWDLIHANMVVHEYALPFDGYWCDGDEKFLPDEPGVYCVYACVRHRDRNTVSLNRLLYIGRSEDVRSRHSRHEKKAEWVAACTTGEEVCYSCACVAKNSLAICEAALIFNCKPLCNDMGKDLFSHSPTRIKTSGCNALLGEEFLVL